MKVRGQGELFSLALASARSLRTHHALLVVGPKGAGKTTAADELVRAFLCESANTDVPCGECAACHRVGTRNHPDLHVLTVAEDKFDISVDQVRALQETLGRRAMEGRARVVLIDPADRLNEQGQNALLKTLEEPGESTFIILVASRPEALLPTVRSRVNRLQILPLEAADLESALAELEIGTVEDRRFAVARAGGSLGRAIELLDPAMVPVHQAVVAFLDRPADMSAIASARATLDGVTDRKEAEARARLVLACLRGALRESLCGSLAQTPDPSYFASAFTSWVAVFECLFDAELDLNLRIAPEQVLANALMHLQEELARLGAARAAAPRS